jgi:hypothetical protein
MPTHARFHELEHEADYYGCMQLRYSFQLYPSPGQQVALAKAFGRARVAAEARGGAA